MKNALRLIDRVYKFIWLATIHDKDYPEYNYTIKHAWELSGVLWSKWK